MKKIDHIDAPGGSGRITKIIFKWIKEVLSEGVVRIHLSPEIDQ